MTKKGQLIIISGPSGVGKGTVCDMVLKKCPKLIKSVSVTTRKPREGEKEGENYFFRTKEQYKKLKEQGGFLETFEIYGNFYGTPIDFVKQNIDKGLSVLLEIDVQGALEVKKRISDALLIFITPPSIEHLRERLKNRNTEDAASFEKRIKSAEEEMENRFSYDYIVENDTAELAADRVLKIISNAANCCN